MSKIDILDHCNFGGPYLLHPKSVFDKNCWVGFQLKSTFFGKNFNLIQDVMMIWYTKVQGGLILDCICKYGTFFIVHIYIYIYIYIYIIYILNIGVK